MRANQDCTLPATAAPAPSGQVVSIFVPDDHPLLQLKRALDWEAISAVMIKHWRRSGKNLDGGAGRPWPVDFYVPALVLKWVKGYHSRQMEEHLSESVVARRFCDLTEQRQMPVRDHSNLARAEAALGEAGLAEANQMVIGMAQQLGFTGPERLSSDTTVQEPRIGYPNEPGIIRGLAERCQRALKKLAKRGVRGTKAAIETTKEISRRVKDYHLWAKTNEQRQTKLKPIVTQAERLLRQTQVVIEAVGQTSDRVCQSAINRLTTMGQVGRRLLGQVKQWIKTGTVASEKIIHAGISQARAIVSGSGRRRVRFGMKWLIHRLRGGYLFGHRVEPRASESQMPIESLRDYRAVFGESATPRLQVYDRGGRCRTTVETLRREKVKKIGLPPRGREAWLVGKKDQQRVKSERGKTEGSIGRLKSQKYGFSHRQERSVETQDAVGQRALMSANLNTLMRDVVQQQRASQAAA
jgi:hypothetical protein